MTSFAIVEDPDVLEERCSRLTAGLEPGAVDHLGFERTEEAFQWSIVEAIPLSAHRGCDAMKSEQFSIISAGILDTPVRMLDQPGRGTPVADRHLQGILAKGAFQALRHGAADDFHRGQIFRNHVGVANPAMRARHSKLIFEICDNLRTLSNRA